MAKKTIEIDIFHHVCRVTGGDEAAISELERLCTLYHGSYVGGEKKVRKIDRLFERDGQSFPTGLLEWLAEELDKANIDVEAYDRRERTPPYLALKKAKLPPATADQEKAEDALLEHDSGAFVKMPGSGKTWIATKAVEMKRVLTLFVAPTSSIRKKTLREWREYWGEANVVDAADVKGGDTMRDLARDKKWSPKVYQINEDVQSHANPEDAYLEEKGWRKSSSGKLKKKNKRRRKKVKSWPPVVVACFQSLDRLPLAYLESVEMVIVDEGHTAACDSILNSLKIMKKACFRYFFSATFWRDKREDLIRLIAASGGKIIHEELPQEAVAAGMTKAVNYREIDPGLPMRDGNSEWLRDIKGPDNIVKRCIVGNITRNKKIVETCYELYFVEKRRILVCVEETAHAEILVQRFREQGMEAYSYFSLMDKDEKDRLEKVASSGTDPVVIVGTMAIGIGTDTRNIDTVFLADGRKSTIKTIQRAGRGTRLANGVNELLILDMKDWFHPTTMRWFSERQKTVREYFQGEKSFVDRQFSKLGVQAIRPEPQQT